MIIYIYTIFICKWKILHQYIFYTITLKRWSDIFRTAIMIDTYRKRPEQTHMFPVASIIGRTLQWRHNGEIASQITSLTIVYPTVYSDADQRKHQSSASLAFVRGIHRGPVKSSHKWPVTRKMFPFDDVIMTYTCHWTWPSAALIVFRPL